MKPTLGDTEGGRIVMVWAKKTNWTDNISTDEKKDLTNMINKAINEAWEDGRLTGIQEIEEI